GHKIKYSIKENPIEGYNSIITGDMTKGFVVTNTIVGKVSVGVTKTWVGPEKDSVVVNLLADGKETGKSVTLNKENKWQYTFENLDKYENGKEIKYTVKENNLDGYKSEVSGDMTKGFVVKNTNIETISIPVVKKWVGKPTDSVTIKLLADGVEKQEIKLDAKNNWKYTFDKLLKYDPKDGHKIKYSIKENPIEGYNSIITGDMTKGFVVTSVENSKYKEEKDGNIVNIPKTGDVSIFPYVSIVLFSLLFLIIFNKKIN
ncbi:MAG: Cna B-type domain-containing protein, partial [Cetobacterium sp.]|nr:Cna B-type domain-containing protein [Cetobacterium sp.]